MSENIPWVEKYRPTTFDNIVLEKTNKELLRNIIKKNYFPNLLFYGPPGTGKTTTIINLINSYSQKNNNFTKAQFIHLNASDDRGIDIIRNQINQFVNTKSLFSTGLKFVILDEVDYMTKNAQQALRYLIQQYSDNVRFCLICNYISRIELSLQHEFIKLKFCQLPKRDITRFLKNIINCEKIKINNKDIAVIQKMFGSDIRSMINFLQSNHNINGLNIKLLSDAEWEKLLFMVKNKEFGSITKFIDELSFFYNVKKKNIIIDFLNYIIKYKNFVYENKEWLTFIKYVIHNIEVDSEYIVNYSILKLKMLLNVLIV